MSPSKPSDKAGAKARMAKPTMTDVARAAGVSQTAVSFVLNHRPDAMIPEETRARIWKAVAELGYRPNAMAQALRLGKSNLIGFVTDEIATTPYAGLIIRGAQDAAWANNRILTLVNTDKRQDLETQAVGALLEHQVEGIIFATMYHHAINLPPILGDLPIALVNCYTDDRKVPSIVPDEEQGGYDATRYLLDHGHRDVAFLNNAHDIPATHGRLAGYKRALQESGLPFRPERVVPVSDMQEGGYAGAQALMQSSDRPTALFCFNDRMAMGAYAALQALGLRVPDDVSVVGFDNQELIAGHLLPTLTTLELPHYAMGKWGIEALLGTGVTSDHVSQAKAPCPLIVRNSVRAI